MEETVVARKLLRPLCPCLPSPPMESPTPCNPPYPRWQAANGILQGCPLIVIVINPFTTTWKRMIGDIKEPVVVATKGPVPQPKELEIPSCWWKNVGTGADQAWIWRCEVPCCCVEMGWMVIR